MPSMPAFALVHLVDDLVLALHRHPVARRRRIVKGLTRRLVRGSGTGLEVVIIDTSTRSEAEASLARLFADTIDLVRTSLADPVLKDRVVETTIARVSELAADIPQRDRRRLIDGIPWAGW